MSTLQPGIDYPTHRNNLGAWANEHGLTDIAIEVGVAGGGFSRIVLSDWKGLRYLMVDPLIPQPIDIFPDGHAHNSEFHKYLESVKQLTDQDKRAIFIRAFSPEVAYLVPDNSVDWIYLDGNHTYDAVRADVLAWYPKVKRGGLFCGHDWNPDRPDFGIKPFVNQWAIDNDLQIGVTECTSWWTRKPL